MTEQAARQILSWTYPPPYDLYNGELTEEGLKEFAENPYYAIHNQDKELVGFYCKGFAAQVPIGYFFSAYPEGYMDIGLGMRPDLTGKGKGTEFLTCIMSTLEQEERPEPLRLTVAEFNKRAIALYEKIGFQKVSEFANASDMIFWVMTKV